MTKRAFWFAKWLQPRWIRALGVVAAGVVLAEVNVLGSRHFARFDLTSANRYTLSEPTRTLLHELAGTTEIVCLLTRDDPLWAEAKHLLDAYRAESRMLKVTFIDPDRDVAAFLALGKSHDLGGEPTAEGEPLMSASFLVRKGPKSWYVRGDQLVEQDSEGNVSSLLEARLSEALLRVGEAERVRVCFTAGHGESGIEDQGPEGLGELARRLERSNLEAVRVALDVPRPAEELIACQVIAVVGPERPFSKEIASLLHQALLSHANLLLLLDPLVTREARFEDIGLLEPGNPLGITLEPGFVVEGDAARRLPRGVGETFFAGVVPHAVTRGLSTPDLRLDARPVLSGVQALVHAAGSPAQRLLESSSQSRLLKDWRQIDAANPKGAQTFILASAIELGATREPSVAIGPHPRAVIVGGSNLAHAESFRDPERYGNRLFVENGLAWLGQRPTSISVPARRLGSGGLAVTEKSMRDLLLYVLLYMPGTAALLGSFIILRRRSLEARSRREVTP